MDRQSSDDTFDDYFAYLSSGSLQGRLYRQFVLFPRLKCHLSGRLLDMGCGIGSFVDYYGDNASGVDINPSTVAYCQKQGLDVQLYKSFPVDFPDHSFDSLVLDNVLEHILDPRDILAEARRLIKPDGVFLIGVPGRKGFASAPDHVVFYDEEKLKKTLLDAGFEQKKYFYTPFKSDLLDRKLSAYCLFGVFKPKMDGR